MFFSQNCRIMTGMLAVYFTYINPFAIWLKICMKVSKYVKVQTQTHHSDKRIKWSSTMYLFEYFIIVIYFEFISFLYMKMHSMEEIIPRQHFTEKKQLFSLLSGSNNLLKINNYFLVKNQQHSFFAFKDFFPF